MHDDNQPRPWATACDSRGRPWPLRITLADALKLRQSGKLDLLGTDCAKNASDASRDPVVLLEIAYQLTAAQRSSTLPPIAEESDWLALFDGDSWQQVVDATMEAVIDFIPPNQRAALKLVWTRQQEQAARAAKAITTRIGDPKTLDRINQTADEALAEFDKKMDSLGPLIRS